MVVQTPTARKPAPPINPGQSVLPPSLPVPITTGGSTDIGNHQGGGASYRTRMNAAGWADPGNGNWLNVWGEKVPDPPDYSHLTHSADLGHGNHLITKWGGPTLKYLEDMTRHDYTAKGFNNYDPVTVARIKTWIAHWSPPGVTRADLGKNSDKQIGSMYLQILTGQVGWDAGGAHPDKIPVIDQIGSMLDAVKKLLGVLFDPNFWLRVGEFAIGAIAIGVGLSHISQGADNAIKSIPIYGKAVNRAMNPAPRRAYQGRHSA